jgi:hypothetical protein
VRLGARLGLRRGGLAKKQELLLLLFSFSSSRALSRRLGRTNRRGRQGVVGGRAALVREYARDVVDD